MAMLNILNFVNAIICAIVFDVVSTIYNQQANVFFVILALEKSLLILIVCFNF